jgi:hypothetical protein
MCHTDVYYSCKCKRYVGQSLCSGDTRARCGCRGTRALRYRYTRHEPFDAPRGARRRGRTVLEMCNANPLWSLAQGCRRTRLALLL